MTQIDKDIDLLFEEPYPDFLAVLEIDPAAGRAAFESQARAWLSAHPTPSIERLAPGERDAVIGATIDRCLSKDAEPLRNYVGGGQPFGHWLSRVADNTCALRARKRRTDAAAEVKTAPRAHSKPVPSRISVVRFRMSLTRALTVSASALLVVTVVIAAVHLSRRPRFDRATALMSSYQATFDAALLTAAQAARSQNDALPVEASGDGGGTRPGTVVFRTERLVVLQLEFDAAENADPPARFVVEDAEGVLLLDLEVPADGLEAGRLSLRISPESFPDGAYTLRAIDGAGATMSSWRIEIA